MTEKNINRYGNRRYQYLKDNYDRNKAEQQEAMALSEKQIASSTAADKISATDTEKFAESFGDEGWAGIFKAGVGGYASAQKQRVARNEHEKREGAMKTMGYFDNINKEIKNDIRKQQQDEYVKQKMKPFMLAYSHKMNELTPTDQLAYANQIIEKSNQLTGSNLKVQSTDGGQPNLWTVIDKDTGEAVFVDAIANYVDDDVLEYEMANNQLSQIIKRRQEQEEKDKKAQLEQDKLNQDIYKNSPNAKFNNKAAELEAERLRDVTVKANETIYNASKVNEILGEMKQIADDNPEIFNSMLMPVWSDTEHTAIKIIAKKLSMFDKDNEKTSNALSEIEKKANELVAIGAKGFGGRANVFIEKIFQSSTPNAGMAKGAFYSVTNDMIEKNNKDIESGYSTLKDYNSKLSHTGVDQFQEGFGGQKDNVNPIRVKDPKTNKTISFQNKEQANLMIRLGGELQ